MPKPNGKPRRMTKEMKKLIVTELACFTAPSDVRDLVEKEHGARFNISTIVYYDPTTADSEVADEWRELFFATRKRFVDDTSRIAISHRSVRLRRLERLGRKLEEKLSEDIPTRNPVLFADLVKRIAELDRQAAEEVGDAYTNKRMLIAGDPETELAKTLGMTVEELRAGIAALDGATTSV